MFRSSYKVARISGIPIKLHISLIAVFIFYAASNGFYAAAAVIASGDRIPGLAAKIGMALYLSAVATGIVLLTEFCILTGITLHELGHSFVARRKGCRIREITLTFIGGVAQMEDIPHKPRDEFEMALAGPAVSMVLGALCWFGGGYLPLEPKPWGLPLVGSRFEPVLCNIVQYFGILNFWWAVFNMLPAFPMDGGRVFRAALTPRMGRLRATRVAAGLGKFTAVVFGLLGLLGINGTIDVPGAWVFIFLAFFLYTAAAAESRMVAMQETFRDAAFMFGARPRRDERWSTSDDSDKVVISPPPYESGPDSESEIESCDEDPFGPRRR